MRFIKINKLETKFPWKIYSRIFPLKDLKYIEYNLLNDKLIFKFDNEVVSRKSSYHEYYGLLDKLNKKEGDIEV